MTPPDGLTRAPADFDDLLIRDDRPQAAHAVVSLNLNGRALIAALGGTIALLFGISFSLPLVFQAMGGFNWEMFRLLHVRNEANIPTLFSSVQLFIAAGLTLLIGCLERRSDGRQAAYWLGLAIMLAGLGIDETAQLHEMLKLVRLPVPDGFLAEWTWIAFYGPAAVLIGCAYGPFLSRLPRAAAALFVLGGAVFLLGAAGLEAWGSYLTHVEPVPRRSHFSVRVHAEELCEMLGVWIFICGAVRHLERGWPRLSLTLSRG